MAALAGVKMAIGHHYNLSALGLSEAMKMPFTKKGCNQAEHPQVITLEEDNQAAHNFMNRAGARQNSTHYPPVYNYLPEQVVDEKTVGTTLILTMYQKADGLTKTLSPAEYQSKLEYLQGVVFPPLEQIEC
jgi:hypothetical protein